jgi:hypothetical protein
MAGRDAYNPYYPPPPPPEDEAYFEEPPKNSKIKQSKSSKPQNEPRLNSSYDSRTPPREQYQPYSHYPPQHPPRPHKPPQPVGPTGKAFRNKGYFKIFILGIIFFLVGTLLASVTGYMTPPDADDYEDENGYMDKDAQERYDNDYKLYDLIKRSLTTTGGILAKIGMILIVVGLFIGAVVDEELHNYIRLGMFIALGFAIAFGL